MSAGTLDGFGPPDRPRVRHVQIILKHKGRKGAVNEFAGDATISGAGETAAGAPLSEVASPGASGKSGTGRAAAE
jgi:hypothetical protein